jgi:hypothetical protein
LLPLLLFLFVGSGCSALIYEIVWFQLLQLVIVARRRCVRVREGRSRRDMPQHSDWVGERLRNRPVVNTSCCDNVEPFVGATTVLLNKMPGDESLARFGRSHRPRGVGLKLARSEWWRRAVLSLLVRNLRQREGQDGLTLLLRCNILGKNPKRLVVAAVP